MRAAGADPRPGAVRREAGRRLPPNLPDSVGRRTGRPCAGGVEGGRAGGSAARVDGVGGREPGYPGDNAIFKGGTSSVPRRGRSSTGASRGWGAGSAGPSDRAVERHTRLDDRGGAPSRKIPYGYGRRNSRISASGVCDCTMRAGTAGEPSMTGLTRRPRDRASMAGMSSRSRARNGK
jgi:hypothetical protein